MALIRKQDPAKFSRYRARLRAQGLKELRLWVCDPAAPGFREDMARQARVLSGAAEDREALGFIEAAADFSGWAGQEDAPPGDRD